VCAGLVVGLSIAALPAFAQDQAPNSAPPSATGATAPEPAAIPVGTVGAVTPADPARPAPTADPASSSADDDVDSVLYEIGPEDVLDISVWKNPELSRTVPVRPDGKVSLPLVNDIKAAGLTPTALRDQVKARLAEFIPAPEVSVIVREVHSRKVAVVGSVKMPGRFEIKSPMTVLEAIALSQGFTDFASRDRIVVLRQHDGRTIRLPFNYGKIADASQENFFVEPGDIIVVP
jgi:polysaccharide export outer membrane protein